MTSYLIYRILFGVITGIGFGVVIHPFIFFRELESYEVFSSFEEMAIIYGITGIIMMFMGFKGMKYIMKKEKKEKKNEA